MIWIQMVVVLVNFLTATIAKLIHPLSAAAVAAKNRKLSSQKRGRKRTCRALPKHANTDFQLGWGGYQTVQKLVLCGVPEIIPV
jgi:hypothetical protein